MSDVPQGAAPVADEPEDDVEVPEDEIDAGAPEGDAETAEHIGDDASRGEGPEGPQPQEVVRRGRSGGRIASVTNENAQLRSRIADFERQLAQIAQQQRQPSPAEIAEQERREAEAVSMMAPAEVARYYADRSERRLATELQNTRQQLWEQQDQAQYDGLLQQHPQLRAYADQMADLKRQAPGVSRRILLQVCLGGRALDQLEAAQTRARNRSARSAEAHTVRPPSNGRGDVAAPTTRAPGGGRWERLRNVQI